MPKSSPIKPINITREETIEAGYPRRRRFRKGWLFLIFLFIIIAAIYALVRHGDIFGSRAKWQAIFLNNGQAYFGHLIRRGDDMYLLANVFYLRSSPALDESAPAGTSFDLVKLGGELHGPESAMHIPQSAVLYWEDLRADSQVVQAIEKSEKVK